MARPESIEDGDYLYIFGNFENVQNSFSTQSSLCRCTRKTASHFSGNLNLVKLELPK